VTHRKPTAATHAYAFTPTSFTVAAHEQRNSRSNGNVLNLKIVPDWFGWRNLASGEIVNNKRQ
jgi:hypothetical protein